MVLYLKYRPQTLEDLVGQESVKKTLQSAITYGKIAHAYLLCGPRGAGKTSTARILAKIINCEKQDPNKLTPIPCNLCPTCLSITNGTNLDVVEMDAASNRGIEDVRTLRENIKLVPTAARKKVYIIDEAHMLTGEAFNALLKTLEEPPSHVVFILATTEAQKIPVTILSRVQKLDFKSANSSEIVESLTKIISAENLVVDKGAINLIAQKSGGSFRDAIKLLDQFSGLPVINVKAIEEILSSGSFESAIALLSSIASYESKQALSIVIKEIDGGVNPKELTTGILEILRKLIFIKEGVGEILVKNSEEEEKYQLLSSVAAKFSLEQLIYTITAFTDSLEQARFSSLPSLPIEVAVVKSSLAKSKSYEDKSVSSYIESNEVVSQPKINVEEKKEVNSQIIKETTSPDSSADDLKKVEEKWVYLLETVRQFNFSLEALLKTAKVLECNPKNVFLEVPYSFHQRIIEAPKSRDILESILSDILGRPIKVIVNLKKRQVVDNEVANVEVAADDEIVRLAAEIFNSDVN